MPKKITTQQLAYEGLLTKKDLLDIEADLVNINGQLIDRVGDTGERFAFDEGTVTITTKTAHRPSGKLEVVFQRDAFLALPPENPVRQAILAAGLVTFQDFGIGGRDPVVQYSLKK